jgi:solute carrier family 25 protein 39/40
MSVPNTVLYFTVYDEISSMMRRNHVQYSMSNNEDSDGSEQLNLARIEDAKRQTYIPLIAGSTARLLASLTTAPLELIRTRQASIVPSGDGVMIPGMVEEFRNLLRINGLASLYVGLAPTLWRDVPFSAVYWMCLERFKNELSNSESLGVWGGRYYQDRGNKIPPVVEALHAFISGAFAGSIAAALTTPFDVVKTRRQMASQVQVDASLNDCHFAVGHGHVKLGLVGHMRQIVEQEGISGLWKGNTTRMVKVAPACAIMISCYEFGKRAFGAMK